MDLNKKNFTSSETEAILKCLSEAASRDLITATFENNEYLLAAFAGCGTEISKKWNVKVYRYSEKRKSHSIVCTDMAVIGAFLGGRFDMAPPDLPVVKIDDSGWGFPIGGVMVGVTDEATLLTGLVPVRFFQEGPFAEKTYLEEYARIGITLVKKLGATPSTHRIEICSGFINQRLRDELRGLGFHVRIVEITGMLQDRLEEEFRAYIRAEVGEDIYYDPKEFHKDDLPSKFGEALEFGRRKCPDKLKTGWKSIGTSKASND